QGICKQNLADPLTLELRTSSEPSEQGCWYLWHSRQLSRQCIWNLVKPHRICGQRVVAYDGLSVSSQYIDSSQVFLHILACLYWNILVQAHDPTGKGRRAVFSPGGLHIHFGMRRSFKITGPTPWVCWRPPAVRHWGRGEEPKSGQSLPEP